MDNIQEVLFIRTDAELSDFRKRWATAEDLRLYYGISHGQAVRLLHRSDRLTLAIDQTGRRVRRILAIPRRDMGRLHLPKGNPKFRDGAFQSRMALKRWNKFRKARWRPETEIPGTHRELDGQLHMFEDEFLPWDE